MWLHWPWKDGSWLGTQAFHLGKGPEWMLRGKRSGECWVLSAASPSLLIILCADLHPWTSLLWILTGLGQWDAGWLLPFVMLQAVCVHFLKVKALFSWHSPCNYLLWVWIASPLRLWAPLWIAHGYWTISGLFLKTYSRQMVSFKNSPQITQSQYVLLEPWLIHTQYFI